MSRPDCSGNWLTLSLLDVQILGLRECWQKSKPPHLPAPPNVPFCSWPQGHVHFVCSAVCFLLSTDLAAFGKGRIHRKSGTQIKTSFALVASWSFIHIEKQKLWTTGKKRFAKGSGDLVHTDEIIWTPPLPRTNKATGWLAYFTAHLHVYAGKYYHYYLYTLNSVHGALSTVSRIKR